MTLKEKLTLVSNQAIFNHSSYGPLFGSSKHTDFFIHDKSNENNNSHAQIGYNYKNNKFQTNNEQSYLAFTGNKLGDFKIM